MNRLLLLLIVCGIVSCGPQKDGGTVLDIKKHEVFSQAKVATAQPESRSTWQKPELVLDKLGNLEGKVVADIGAGTGYFAYRLAFRGAQVLALDVDPEMINLMTDFRDNLPADIQSRITPTVVSPDDPALSKNEIDYAIIINTIAYISDKTDYLQRLRQGTKPGGKVVIVDYKNRDLNIPAPPLTERVSVGSLQAALREAGYLEVTVDDNSLDYQYIISAVTP